MPDISGLDVCRFRQVTVFWRLQELWAALRGTQR